MNQKTEPLWHMELSILAIISVQLALGDRFSFGFKDAIIILACVQLLMLILVRNSEHPEKDRWHWRITLLMTAFMTVVNLSSLLVVFETLITHPKEMSGQALILSAIGIFFTNIVLFGLWYWQLDGGGPGGRGNHKPPIDFLFPQMYVSEKITKTPNWAPDFTDYLYLSLTNATALSPTDSMPLTNRAKLFMAMQSFISGVTVVIVVTRAVAILS